MKVRKSVGFLLLAVTLLLPLGASVYGQAEEKMLFVMAYPSDIGELNPMFYRSERSHWYDMLVYDTLITYDDDTVPMPWLAEDWTVSADGRSATFTIRDGVTWHDGTALTAEDVKFTFDYYKAAPTDANQWTFMQHMTEATVSGSDVTATFNRTFTFLVENIGALYILPKHIREGVDANDERWDDATDVAAHTGSGPF